MRTILAAVLADIRRLEAVPDRPSPGISRDQWREAWRERQELEPFGVRHDLARWLGYPPSASDSAVISRTLRQMEDLGLLARVNRWGRRGATRVGRTTHVRLTPAGERRARELAPEEVPEPDEAFDLDGMEIEPLYLPEEREPVAETQDRPPDPVVVAIARAFTWQEALDAGDVGSVEALAERLGVDGSYVRRILQLASLSPAAVEAALERGGLDGISLTALSKDLPLDWQRQADRLGL